MPNRSTLAKVVTLAFLVATVAVMAMAASPAALAQEEPEYGYVDLVMLYEHQFGGHPEVLYSVHNAGTTAATGVSVSFLLEDLRAGEFNLLDHAIAPSITGKKTVETTNQVFTWVIGAIPPGGASRQLEFGTSLHSGHDVSSARLGVINAEASSNQPEPDHLLTNNEIKVYSYHVSGGNFSRHMYRNALGLLVSVDNLRPAPGDDVDFVLTAINNQGAGSASINLIADAKVKVELSDGLEFKTAWTPPAEFVKSGSQSATWSPPDTAGDADHFPESHKITIETQLIMDSLDLIPLEDRCITARVTDGIPPPDPTYVFGSLKQCLGDDPTVLFQSGRIDLFTVHPCAGSATIIYPCRDDDGVSGLDNELELVAKVDDYLSRPELRANGVGRIDAGQSTGGTKLRLRPETVVIHIKDPEGRIDDNGNVSWEINASGMEPYIDNRLLVGTSVWTKIKWIIASVNLPASGSMTMGPESTRTFKWLDTTSKLFHGPFDNSQPDNFVQYFINAALQAYIKFNKLGTYTIKFTQENTHATHGDLTVTGQYIFHVGPIAELEARDGGANPELDGGQRAFTIMAVNNALDEAPAAQVTLTGLNANDYESHTATAGSFDPATGVWTIGEMKNKDFHQGRYGRDGEVLTIITSAASAPDITAAISNTRDYRVCIDSSANDVEAASESACTATSSNTWHTTEYYDYIPGNNRATIAARAGTGEGHPDAARELRVMETRVGNVLTWQPVESVNRYRVSHYEVQRWASGWTPLANRVTGTVYLDTEGRANADYRVRAVNEVNQEGPWSITGRPPDAPGNFSVALSDSGNAAVLSWTEPASPSPITGYVIDISDSADGDSRTNDATVGANVTTWTHTGLSPGDVKFYRVQARNRDGVGPWTGWMSVGAGPGRPGNLRAQPNGSSETVLTWNAASSRDVPIYEYELEYSDTSASEGYAWNFLQTVLPHEGLRYVDDTVVPGTTRHYRVRAWTVGDQAAYGAWSNVASATTPAAGPSPPLNVFADFEVGNTENGILLTWEAPASGNASYYRIEHSTDGGTTWELESARHTGTCDDGGTTKFCYTDRGLFSGTEHWYRVAGVNSSGVAGEWARSNSHMTQGQPTSAPGEPQNLRVTSVSGRQVSLAWDAPEDDGGSPVTGYEYQAQTACAHDPTEICQVLNPTRTSGTTATVTVPNVKGYYEFSVRALNAAGAGHWTQSVSQYINPQRNWRVTVSPSSLTVPEGGERTYRVTLTSDPRQPVMLLLWWDGDPDLGNTLSYQQFKYLLPSNYQNPDIYLDPEYSAAWNVGVTITVTADEDADSENGTALIDNIVFYVPCAELGNPAGCVDDPEDAGVSVWLTVTEQDND